MMGQRLVLGPWATTHTSACVNEELRIALLYRMFLAGGFVGMILARGKFVVSEEDDCNICVFTLYCFLIVLGLSLIIVRY